MNVLITGGTGLIGTELCEQLLASGNKVFILTRKVKVKLKTSTSPVYIEKLTDTNQSYDVIVNLAGEPLNRKRWNEQVKKTIVDSRIQTTQNILNYIKNAHVKPKLLISGSAIGFYGSHESKVFSEDSTPEDHRFTHRLCREWEQVAMQATDFGVRVCLLRTGIVLGRNGGALKEMMMPFKFGLGAQLGDGKQWMSWIHIRDVVGAIEHLIKHDNLSGPFNLTSPLPVTNAVFSKKLAATLKRPLIFKFPNFFVKALFGEMGAVLLLQGQNVVPNKLLSSGYPFHFRTLDKALENLLK